MKRNLAKKYFKKYQESHENLGLFVAPIWRRGKKSKCYKSDIEIWTAYHSLYDDELEIWKRVENKHRSNGGTHTTFLKRRKVPEINWWCNDLIGCSTNCIVDSSWLTPFARILAK